VEKERTREVNVCAGSRIPCHNDAACAVATMQLTPNTWPTDARRRLVSPRSLATDVTVDFIVVNVGVTTVTYCVTISNTAAKKECYDREFATNEATFLASCTAADSVCEAMVEASAVIDLVTVREDARPQGSVATDDRGGAIGFLTSIGGATTSNAGLVIGIVLFLVFAGFAYTRYTRWRSVKSLAGVGWGSATKTSPVAAVPTSGPQQPCCPPHCCCPKCTDQKQSAEAPTPAEAAALKETIAVATRAATAAFLEQMRKNNSSGGGDAQQAERKRQEYVAAMVGDPRAHGIVAPSATPPGLMPRMHYSRAQKDR
jgi:hypothetical protein